MILKKIRYSFVFIILGLLVIGCRGDEESITPSQTIGLSPTASSLSQTPSYEPYVAPVYPPPIATMRGSSPYPGPSEQLQTPVSTVALQATQVPPTIQVASPTPMAPIISPYPGPGISPYPGPGTSPTPAAGISPYPEPGTSIPTAIRTIQATTTIFSPFTQAATLAPGTLTTSTPTARISKPLGTPPPPPSTITIWHSWRDEKLAVLDFVIQSFQDQFPDVYFNLLYIPFDELYENYRQAAYYGRGPSILFGPADWGPPLYDNDLIVDLLPYTNPEFLTTINSAALETGMYRGALIGLPHAQSGSLLIRNRAIISRPPESLEDMINLSTRATRGSIFGAYIERGSFFSAAHLVGLGGDLMDENFNPGFNDQYGVNWLELLLDFNRIGPTSFNGDNDVELFKAGQVGMIIDGSWNLDAIVEALGEDSVAVDPWPITEGGSLSGFVQTDSLFLNANSMGDEQHAALRFMGFLLDKEVQGLLAEAGLIPSVIDAQPQSDLIRSAMNAFRGGTPYPVVPTSEFLRPYWDSLNVAIQSVIDRKMDPLEALQVAQDYISDRLVEIRVDP